MRENKYVVRQNELLDDITVLLAGREAERLVFGEISGGAWDDLRKASDIATFMVQELAMTMDNDHCRVLNKSNTGCIWKFQCQDGSIHSKYSS